MISNIQKYYWKESTKGLLCHKQAPSNSMEQLIFDSDAISCNKGDPYTVPHKIFWLENII